MTIATRRLAIDRARGILFMATSPGVHLVTESLGGQRQVGAESLSGSAFRRCAHPPPFPSFRVLRRSSTRWSIPFRATAKTQQASFARLWGPSRRGGACDRGATQPVVARDPSRRWCQVNRGGSTKRVRPDGERRRSDGTSRLRGYWLRQRGRRSSGRLGPADPLLGRGLSEAGAYLSASPRRRC